MDVCDNIHDPYYTASVKYHTTEWTVFNSSTCQLTNRTRDSDHYKQQLYPIVPILIIRTYVGTLCSKSLTSEMCAILHVVTLYGSLFAPCEDDVHIRGCKVLIQKFQVAKELGKLGVVH